MFDVIDELLKIILSKRSYRITLGLLLIVGSLFFLAYSVLIEKGAKNLSYLLNDILQYAPFFLPLLLGLGFALVEPKRIRGRRLREVVKDEKEILRNKSSELVEIFHIFRLRMLYDSDRLKFNSNKNLAIGIFFSFFALSLLAYFVFLQPAQIVPNYVDFALQWYLPKISIVLLLQFVGFFFLRLYVASELDIKHNKNEITNVEAQIMAYAMAKDFGLEAMKPVIEAVAKTERNFVIKKDEKTISVENLSEFNDLKGMMEKLINKVPDK